MDIEENTRISVSVIALAASCIQVENEGRKRKRNRTSVWVKPWFLKREEYGAFNGLLSNFRIEDKI